MTIGDVANSTRPLLIIPKVPLRLRVPAEVQLNLRVTHRSWKKFFAGKKLRVYTTIYVREAASGKRLSQL